MDLGWVVRGVAAGAAGTAAMTAAYRLEHRVRRTTRDLDYDDSEVPGEIVASILHLGDLAPIQDRRLGLALRWSYGSAFGAWHGILRSVMPEPWAGIAFGSTLLGITFAAFPLLGRTPPPWDWPRDVLATAVGTHVVYTVTVAAVDDRLNRA
jgi:hypothetical protein